MNVRPVNLLKWAFGLVLAAYVGALALLYVFQRSFLYVPPHTARTKPAAVGFPAEEIVLDTADGEKVMAWHVPPQAGKFVVLYFHGNGDVLALRVPRLREAFTDGTGLVAVSYRGYAGSTGQPSQKGLLADAAAAKVSASVLVMHGERDAAIPIRLGERLFALAREPKRFVRFPNGGHDDLDAHGSIAAVREFLYGAKD